METLWQNSGEVYKTEGIQREYFSSFFHIYAYMHKKKQVFIEEIFICIHQQIQILIFIWQCRLHI